MRRYGVERYLIDFLKGFLWSGLIAFSVIFPYAIFTNEITIDAIVFILSFMIAIGWVCVLNRLFDE